MSDSFRLRPAVAEDRDFLTDMVVLAVNWLPDRNLSREDILQTAEHSHYISGWMLPTDLGLIAMTGDGIAIGAAWLRQLTADDPGYGYVADDVPELSMAVLPAWRGRGVGRALIRALVADAQTRRIRAVSLSVERANHAAHLYAEEGFNVVEAFDDANTMMLSLP